MSAPIIGPAPLTPEWFEAHKQHVSATAVARIMTGEAFAVYSEMRGEIPPFAGNAFTRRGQRYERPILEEYAETKPAALVGRLPLLIDAECNALAATPDAFAVPADGVQPSYCDMLDDCAEFLVFSAGWGCEAKFSMSPAVAHQLGEEESDEVPDKWLWQTMSQMAVCGWEYVDVAILLFGRLRVMTVKRHDRLIDQCRATATEMLDRVQRGLPPPIDFTNQAAQDAVRAVYGKPITGKIVDLDEAAEAVVTRRQEAQQAESAAEKAKKAADAELLAIMAGAEMATLPSGLTVRRGTVHVGEQVRAAYDYERFWFKKGK